MARQVQVNVAPHPAQRLVHNDPARFKVLSAGRRWGKTRLGVMECLDTASRGGRAWWIAPSYKISEVGWRPLANLARQIPGVDVRLNDREVRLPNGGSVAVRSADSEGGLRGEGLDFVVMDEAAFMRGSAWSEEIRPALSDRLGKALFISTPKGRNWFWNVFMRGQANEPGWASFQFPTLSNPYIKPAEIEDAKRDIPELIFRQEYLAEFVDMEGSVFRRIQEAIDGEPLEGPEPGHEYIAGVDVASSVDYTVVAIIDTQYKRLVFMDRFNRIDYNVLEDRLRAIYDRWGLRAMVVESNSIGQPVIDRLQNGMNVQAFATNGSSKQQVITGLQSAFEHAEIKIANYPILVGELLSYESKRSPSGSFTYSAPAGMHDDTVMALAIGWDAVHNRVSSLVDFG